jgi:hypothetical protein
MSLEYTNSEVDVFTGAPQMIERMKALSKKYSSV